jgi:hypothetical protein
MYTHQGYFQRYQEITHQFLLFLKLTLKLNLLHCKSNHKIFFILKENPKGRTSKLMKIGVKSYTKIMSHFIDGLYMLCYGVLLKGDRLSQIFEQQEREQHLVS